MPLEDLLALNGIYRQRMHRAQTIQKCDVTTGGALTFATAVLARSPPLPDFSRTTAPLSVSLSNPKGETS